MQQGAAARAPELSLRRPLASARALLASSRWIAGFVLGLGGWAPLLRRARTGAAVARADRRGQRHRPARRARRRSPGGRCPVRREQRRRGARDARPDGAGRRAPATRARRRAARRRPARLVRARGGRRVVVVACALRRRSAALGGLAAGLCYGIGDVTSKSLLIALPHHPTAAALLASPLLYATAGAHGLGFVAAPARVPARRRRSPRSAR